jgi:hypothetical protein
MKQATRLFIALFLAVILSGCSEKAKNPVGFHLWDEEGPWRVHQFVTQNVLADSSFHVTRTDGIGAYLLVGSYESQEARSLLAFQDLPDTLAWPLSTATLNLIASSEAGEDSLLISAYALETPWSDSTATWNDPWTAPGGDHAPEVIAQGAYAVGGGAQLDLELNAAGVELVQGWLQGQPNNGIILMASGWEGDNLKYFYSEDTPYYPALTLTFATGDTTDTTIIVDSDKDTFIAQPLTLPGEDLLMVSDGDVYRTWLQFDLSVIPESSFINLATLSLSVSEFHDPLNSMTVRAYSVSDPATLDYDTTPYGYSSLYTGKDLAEFNITLNVQNWVYGAEKAGVILKTYSEYSDISRVLFYSSLTDTLHRPTLTVTYTLPPVENLARRNLPSEEP